MQTFSKPEWRRIFAYLGVGRLHNAYDNDPQISSLQPYSFLILQQQRRRALHLEISSARVSKRKGTSDDL